MMHLTFRSAPRVEFLISFLRSTPPCLVPRSRNVLAHAISFSVQLDTDTITLESGSDILIDTFAHHVTPCRMRPGNGRWQAGLDGRQVSAL
jgi:hypothetical protein